jgi:hypothetical protein
MTFSNSRYRMAGMVTVAAAVAAVLTACAGGSTPSAAALGSNSPTATASQIPGQTTASQSPGQSMANSPACSGTAGATVSTASQLSQALASAAPGATIVLAPGDYAGNFQATTSGTAARPITLCGPRGAVLDGGAVERGYTLHLDHASWWRLEGFSVMGGQKGVLTDGSDHDLIDGLYVHDIGDEAIHLRDFSSDDTVTHNVIRATGLHSSFFGEGIYVGSAHKNWCRYSGCKPDGSDNNIITGNTIAQTTAESIDIKEGTIGGIISGNHFNGTGMNSSSATSWVNVKGNDWKITDNTGSQSVQDGLSDHQVYPGWGLDNVFTANVLTVNGPGFGIYVQRDSLGVTVDCDNKAAGAQRGLSNLACTAA